MVAASAALLWYVHAPEAERNKHKIRVHEIDSGAKTVDEAVQDTPVDASQLAAAVKEAIEAQKETEARLDRLTISIQERMDQMEMDKQIERKVYAFRLAQVDAAIQRRDEQAVKLGGQPFPDVGQAERRLARDGAEAGAKQRSKRRRRKGP